MSVLNRHGYCWIVAVAVIFAALAFGTTVASAAPNDDGTLTIAHFAPFADTIDGTAVDVWVDGAVAIPDVKYPDLVRGVVLPEGEYLVQIALAGTDTVIISDTLTIMSGVDYTVAAIGGANDWTPEYYPLVNDLSAPADGTGKVRISHLAPFAATEDGTRVDICTEDDAVVAGLAGVPYKVSSPYLELAAGAYDLKVTAAGSDCGTTLIDVPAFTLLAGAIVDVFAVGDGGNQAPAIVVNDQSPAATVNVAHFAPFAPTLAGTSVTVRVDGADAIPNFEFGDVVNDVELAAGEHLVEIVPTGTNTVALSDTLTLLPGGIYSVIAQGDVDNQPLGLKVLNDATAAPAAGNGKLRVGHLAPFAAEPADTAVDICLASGIVVPGLDNVAYDVVSPFLELPAGDYDLLIAVAGTNCQTVALDIPSVRLADGAINDAFAIGKVLGDDTSEIKLQIATILGIELTPAAPATVDIVHFAPFGDGSVAAAGLSAASVTVRVDGGDVRTNFMYGDIVNDAELPAGEHLIEILPSGSDTVAISETVTLAPGGDYTVIAIGDVQNQLLALKVLNNDTAAPADGNAKIRIGHLAPFASDTDATRVDICTATDNIVPGLASVPYGVISDYLELPATTYDLKIAVAGSNCATVALDIDPFILGNGEVADVYAIGKANDVFPLAVSSVTGLTPGGPTAIDGGHEPVAPTLDEFVYLPFVK